MKLSHFLTNMVASCKKLDRNHYIPDAGCWHWSEQRDINNAKKGIVCFTCLAGAWVATTTDIPYTETVNPVHIPENYKVPRLMGEHMRAIEEIRLGNYHVACKLLDIEPPPYSSYPCPRKSDFKDFEGWTEFNLFLLHLNKHALYFQQKGY